MPGHGESTAAAIQQAIFEQDAEALQKGIETYLIETVSVFDTGSEAFYQGLMIGLCAILNNQYSVRSNRESGLGRFDIQLRPMDSRLPGLIFELKASRKDDEDLEALAYEALHQIDQMRYETEMRSEGIREVLKAGIAFRGKEVVIRTE
ncbi:MAG: PD-(D/E)XK nuclease domain-containing protein [Oscillospiraceae bacterium]|nr:PD-(D/E)XK nuclease domain-containing protein [Oscillospiraceae bacterium]